MSKTTPRKWTNIAAICIQHEHISSFSEREVESVSVSPMIDLLFCLRPLILTIVRFCSQAGLDPDILLENLTAADVKSWFDWIEKNFEGSIKAHSTLANYWRTLKRLYFMQNRHEMETRMQGDCLNMSDSFLDEAASTLC